MTLDHLKLSPEEVRKHIEDEMEKLRLELMLKVIAPETVILEYRPMTVGVPTGSGWQFRKGVRRSKAPFVMRGMFNDRHVRSRFRTFEGLAAAVRRL